MTLLFEEHPEQEYGTVREPGDEMEGLYDDVLRDVESFTSKTYDTDPDLLVWNVEHIDTSFYRGSDDTIVLNGGVAYEEHVLAHEAGHAIQDQEVEDSHLLSRMQKEGFAQWIAEELSEISPLEASDSPRVRTGEYYAGRELYRAHAAVYGAEETLKLAFRRLEREDRDRLMDAVEDHGEVPYRNMRSIRDRI